jgi:hypothetical protein
VPLVYEDETGVDAFVLEGFDEQETLAVERDISNVRMIL